MSANFIVTQDHRQAQFYLEHVYPHCAEGILVSADGIYPESQNLKDILDKNRQDVDARYILFGATLKNFVGCRFEQCFIMDSLVLNAAHINQYMNLFGLDQPLHIAAVVKAYFEQSKMLHYSTDFRDALKSNTDFQWTKGSMAEGLYG